MERAPTYMLRKIRLVGLVFLSLLIFLSVRIAYLMVLRGEYYATRAMEVEQRERNVKAARGRIIDRNGVVLASNKSVCTVSVIHNQIEDEEAVIQCLIKELEMPEDQIKKRVKKLSSIEKIKSNVPKEVGDAIREYHLAGIKVDDDYKRVYPYDGLLSKVLGFTGADNQGIIGIESYYDSYLQGQPGKILTFTDAKGIEIENQGEGRIEPVEGNDLYVTLDYNISQFANQLAYQTLEKHQASSVEILVMNPQNGDIYAMVNAPEFPLNDPFSMKGDLNQIWRNTCVSDTYEPGSVFKIITTAAALEEGLVALDENFCCTGSITVEDTRIRCHKTTGHGNENFVEAIMNSCNPVFIQLGLRLGSERYYSYFEKFGLLEKTGIDLPGEANTIMHKKENIGPVELATISFGQSFQVTPIQMAATVASLVNGGKRITPHIASEVRDKNNQVQKVFSYDNRGEILTEQSSATLRFLLEQVVSEGTGKNAKVSGFSVGGKTATSQMLPRGSGKYIASFLGFAPADHPTVLALVIIHEPVGTYYGGTIAAPVASQLFENILPYLKNIEK